MADLDSYLENPYWRRFYRYSMGPPNEGYMKRWVEFSPGNFDGMFLWSNEYSYTNMKHGENNISPYRGGVQKFSSSVTPQLMGQVSQCIQETMNPGGCENEAVRQVFTHDSTPSYMRKYEKHVPGITPHPYGVSYRTGYSPNGSWIPPSGPQD
jgi:hypothetical protein